MAESAKTSGLAGDTAALFPAAPNAYSATDMVFCIDPPSERDEDELNNETLQRLLNEVTLAVADDDDEDANQLAQDTNLPPPPPRAFGADERGVPYSTISLPASAPPDGAAASTRSFSNSPGAAVAASGFIVEGSTTSLPLPSSVALHAGLAPPPPPPLYGTPQMGAATPYVCYSGIPYHSASKPPPPSFAEAIASTTPVSLNGRPSPLEMTPTAAHYVPPGPAAVPDSILLRNSNGVFMLNPIAGSAKPTPAYTPPAGRTTPPISPLPRYSLPPPQAVMGSNFLGSSVAQSAHTAVTQQQQQQQPPQRMHSPPMNGSATELPPPPPQYSSNAFMLFAQPTTSLRSTPLYGAAPPPYAP